MELIDLPKILITFAKWLSSGLLGFAVMVILIEGYESELPPWLLFSITFGLITSLWLIVFGLIGIYKRLNT